jgi:MFS family permease
MLKKRLYKIAGFCSIIQAVLYIIIVGLFALIFQNQNSLETNFVMNYSLTIICWSLVFLALLGFIVAPMTASLFDKKYKVLANLGKLIALLSLFVMVSYYMIILLGKPSNINLLPNLVGWFMFGGMGLWVVIVAILTLITSNLPKRFSVICTIKTIGFWIILIGLILNQISLIKIGAIIGGLIGGVIYHIWLGAIFLRMKK